MITNIIRAVADAKEADNQTRRLPSNTAPGALSPPRPEAPLHVKQQDTDDEIPF
jgi:hypothetical protein